MRFAARVRKFLARRSMKHLHSEAVRLLHSYSRGPMRIAVVGSGYVGLVASACLAELGHQVVCVDNDQAKIAALVRGEVPIHEEFLPELLARHRGERLHFSGSLAEAMRD